MNKKTIIYIGGFELPDKNAAAQRVLSNAKIFRELGFNIIFIGIDKNLQSGIKLKDTKFTVEGFEAYSIPYPSSKIKWFKYLISIKYLKKFIEDKYTENLYAVIAYNYPAIAQYRIKKEILKKKLLLIADVTEWYESSGGGILFNTIKWIDTTLRMRFVNLRADALITISKYLTEFYQKRKIITVNVPTLYDIENLFYDSSLTNNPNILKLVYAGSAFNPKRVNKSKNNIKDRLDKIIHILGIIHGKRQDFILNIYGMDKKNYLSVFPEHTQVLDKLMNNIIFHGRKPHAEIVNQIKKSDFSIFIRDIDRVIEAGFPSKFSESISYGTPVISNMISNIEDYAVEGKNNFTLSLSNESNQIEKMIKILNLSLEEKANMKKYCLNNKIFDYKRYNSLINSFLHKIETNNVQ